MKKGTISTVVAISLGALMVYARVILNKKISQKDETLKKLCNLYMVFNQWLQIRQEGKSLLEYFKQKNYKTIAVYGMKELGERLCDELNDSDVTVSYLIDKNADSIYYPDIEIITPNDELKPVDAIVVTAIYYFDEIEEMLRDKIDCPIISLEDILYEI